MATHSSTVAWKIPWTEERGRLQTMGLKRVRHNWATSRSLLLSRALRASQVARVVKNLPTNAGDIRDISSNPGSGRDMGSNLGSGRSPGGRRGNPLQYSCLENLMDRGVWQTRVHRVEKSRTWLKRFSMHPSKSSVGCLYSCLELSLFPFILPVLRYNWH